MKIILIHKELLEKRPPVISVITNLLELGHEIILIDNGVNEYWRKKLDAWGVVHHAIPQDSPGKLGKLQGYWIFRRQTFKLLRKYLPNGNEGLLWIEGAHTLVALGTGIKHYRYILQIQELHEQFKYQLRAIGKVINQAEVVFMPEYNRTVLYQVWFHLMKRPIVLPNKPYFLPSVEELNKLRDKYAEWMPLFARKKVILYQGHISSDRDMSAYVKAIKELGDEYCLVMVGTDHGKLKDYKAIDANLVHIDFVPAPDYLLFTSLAYIGILSYSSISVNNIYCAPNKIFEYTAYGLPVIGNDIPGLYYLINEHKIGSVVDENDVDSIKSAITNIDKQHDEQSRNAVSFYNATDNKKIIEKALGV